MVLMERLLSEKEYPMKVNPLQIGKEKFHSILLILILSLLAVPAQASAQTGGNTDRRGNRAPAPRARSEPGQQTVNPTAEAAAGPRKPRRQITQAPCDLHFVRLKSHELDAPQASCLELLAKRIIDEEAFVVIDGHRDGSEDDKEDVSLKRAKTVSEFLISKGVDGGSIIVKDLGKSCPPPADATNKSNRRVNVWIIPKEGAEQAELDLLRKCPVVQPSTRPNGAGL
jgi:outer membrane protein OmpA-like peptidoglycan-associated protein